MTQVELLEALKSFLEESLKNINLLAHEKPNTMPIGSLRAITPLSEGELPEEQEDEEPAKVNIFEGFVPNAKSNDSYFPYVSIFILEGSTNLRCSTAKVQFDLGVYTPNEEEGIKPLLNLLQRLLFNLNTLENYILDEKFTLNPEISWQIAGEDTRPYYNAAIITEWDFLNPQPESKEIWKWD